MPSTYAHNAIGGETEKAKGTETKERREEAERADRTSDRQVNERARLEMFLTISPLPSRSMI